MVFRDRPFAERMAEAARIGYSAVEFWDFRDKDIAAIVREAGRLGLTIAAFSGNRRHSLIDPAARAGLLDEMEQVFDVAEQLRCSNIMMLSDVLAPDGSAAPSPDATPQARLDSIAAGLSALAARIETRPLTLLLEPLNTVLDHRGCFLDSSDATIAVLERVGHPRIRMLYDAYHLSMMGEDAAVEIEKNADWIGYVHAADMPGRHEPGSGRIAWTAIRAALARRRYQGFIGMEFSPLAPDADAARRAFEAFA